MRLCIRIICVYSAVGGHGRGIHTTLLIFCVFVVLSLSSFMCLYVSTHTHTHTYSSLWLHVQTHTHTHVTYIFRIAAHWHDDALYIKVRFSSLIITHTAAQHPCLLARQPSCYPRRRPFADAYFRPSLRAPSPRTRSVSYTVACILKAQSIYTALRLYTRVDSHHRRAV